MVTVNKTKENNMKEELQRMRARLLEENDALLKLIRELNGQAETNHMHIKQKPKTIKP
jgi:hypothetical protein